LAQLNSRYSEKLLAWSILHRYFSIIGYFQNELNACVPGDFKSLAHMVFPLTGENACRTCETKSQRTSSKLPMN
jgi:hypothetical protein